MEFICKLNNIETTTPWKRPTYQSVKDWYLSWSNEVDIEGFEVYLIGAFAEKLYGNNEIETWDADVVMIGDISDYSKLKNIMERGIAIAFEKELLIDLFYNDKLLDKDKTEFPIRLIRPFNSIYIKRDSIITDMVLSENSTEIEEGLWETLITKDSKSIRKFLKRYAEGKYKGAVINIKDLQ